MPINSFSLGSWHGEIRYNAFNDELNVCRASESLDDSDGSPDAGGLLVFLNRGLTLVWSKTL